MPTSQRSSTASAACRLEWRPSRWVGGSVALLTLLAPWSVLASEMPLPLAAPLALLAFAHGIRTRQRYRATPGGLFAWQGDGTVVTCDGTPIREALLQWRGPLAFLRWRDAQGRIRRRAWWPDTLPAERRRELRLAARMPEGAPGAGGMAH